METSEQTDLISAALAKAQGELKPVAKSTVNTYFKSKYATLADCAEASYPVLSKNGLALIQGVHGHEFVCRLAHESGQWYQNRIPIPGDLQGMNAQQLGAATTYLRRQSYSMVGLVADEDDDGNSVQDQKGLKKGIGVHSPLGDPAPSDLAVAFADEFREAVDNGTVPDVHARVNAAGEEVYRSAWALLDSKTRSAIKKALGK